MNTHRNGPAFASNSDRGPGWSVRTDGLAGDDATKTDGRAERSGDEPLRLQLHKEQLRITKEPEPIGTVMLRRRTVEPVETVQALVREERLAIENHAGGGKVMVGERELAGGEAIEVTLSTERIVVTKEPNASDVVVRKETVERMQQVQETLRKEQLTVDEAASDRRGDAALLREEPPRGPLP